MGGEGKKRSLDIVGLWHCWAPCSFQLCDSHLSSLVAAFESQEQMSIFLS